MTVPSAMVGALKTVTPTVSVKVELQLPLYGDLIAITEIVVEALKIEVDIVNVLPLPKIEFPVFWPSPLLNN